MDRSDLLIGPLGEAYVKAVTFAHNLADAFYLNDLLQRIEKLENLLEEEDLLPPTRNATELLLEQLNNNLQDMLLPRTEDERASERNETR